MGAARESDGLVVARQLDVEPDEAVLLRAAGVRVVREGAADDLGGDDVGAGRRRTARRVGRVEAVVGRAVQRALAVARGVDRAVGADGTVDASGDGKGTLYRSSNYGFNAAYPTSCPSTAGADVVATKVISCTFSYDPNPGGTQQYGFVWLDIELSRNNETVGLASGAHVVNAP